MPRKVKEIVQIDNLSSIDGMIDALVAIRASLPADTSAELLLRGCDVFGRHIAVAFMRPQTPDEEAFEARYAANCAERLKQRERERVEAGARRVRA